MRGSSADGARLDKLLLFRSAGRAGGFQWYCAPEDQGSVSRRLKEVGRSYSAFVFAMPLTIFQNLSARATLPQHCWTSPIAKYVATETSRKFSLRQISSAARSLHCDVSDAVHRFATWHRICAKAAEVRE